MVIFVEISARKCIFFEISWFPSSNVHYTSQEVKTMLSVSAPIISMPNIANSHLTHFIYVEYYFLRSGYKSFYSYTIANGYKYVA